MYRTMMLVLSLLLLGSVESVLSAESVPIKRLTRQHPWCLSEVDDHLCTRERTYREEDYLASLSEKERTDYERKADNGDADAMYLLSQIPKEREDGKREYPYRGKWLPRAADAGHPIAQFERAEEAFKKRERIASIKKMAEENKYPDMIYLYSLIAGKAVEGESKDAVAKLPDASRLQVRAKELTAEDAYTGKPLTEAHYLELIEAAALAQGSGDIAWRLAFAYQGLAAGGDVICSDEDQARKFSFLQADPEKALYWAKVAANKGNIAAAEDLCNSYYWVSGDFRLGITKRDSSEAARWCTLAAQAMCSVRGSMYLSRLYREGIGVPKSEMEELYWIRVYGERKTRHYVPLDKWEYVGGNSHE